MTEEILIISYSQYGYHSDPFHYAKYLSDFFKVLILCPDNGYKKVTPDVVNVKYVKIPIKKLIRFLYIFYIIKFIYGRKKSYICIVFRFPYCFFLPLLFNRRRFIYDIRSGGVTSSKVTNFRKNLTIRWNSLFFENITIISESLAELLKINEKKIHILPLGARLNPQVKKDNLSLRLLYVGTFDNRNIKKTIIGFKKFYQEFSSLIETNYTLIGFGSLKTIAQIKNQIIQDNLDLVVTYESRKTHDELIPYFQKSNIGVSFVPITKYYNVQPPTKTFEYLLAGMMVIATSTQENRKVINDKNGVLINDTADSFYEGLKNLYYRLNTYDSEMIIKESQEYTWEYIVKFNLKPYLFSLIEGNE